MEIKIYQISVRDLIEWLSTGWADSAGSVGFGWIWPLDPKTKACWATSYQSELEIASRRSVSPDGTSLRREYVGLEPVSWSTRSGFSIVPDYSQKLITSSFTYICL